jgi:PBP1b-binding outer membrane lipoprotein LpoB
MKKLQGISGLSLVALLLVSCTSKTNVSTAPKQEPSVEPVSVAPNSVMPSPIQESAPKGLIPSTNPTTLPIAKGRIDPFSSVIVLLLAVSRRSL